MRKRDRDRAEALRLVGGAKPSLRDRAVTLANERGVLRTRDLTDICVPRCYLARMCEEGLLIEVGYGQYRAADVKQPKNTPGDFLAPGSPPAGKEAV